MRDLKAVGKKFYHVLYPRESRALLQECKYLKNFNMHLISLRHSVNGDFCGHSRFVLWHENLTTFVSWTLAKSESWGGGEGLALIS